MTNPLDDYKEYIQRWLCRFTSENTRHNYRHHINEWAKFCSKHAVDPMGRDAPLAAVDWVKELEGKNRSATVGNKISALRSMYDFLLGVGAWSGINPFNKAITPIPNPSRDRGRFTEALTEEELSKVYATLNEVGRDAEGAWRFAIVLMVECGLRCSEVLSLVASDYDSSRGLLLLRSTKAQDTVEVWIPPKYHALVESRRSAAGGMGAGLLPFSEWKLREVWESIAMAVGLNLDTHPLHCLRKTAITRFYRACGDIEKTRRFARHASIITTQRYLDVKEEEVRAVQERMAV